MHSYLLIQVTSCLGLPIIILRTLYTQQCIFYQTIGSLNTVTLDRYPSQQKATCCYVNSIVANSNITLVVYYAIDSRLRRCGLYFLLGSRMQQNLLITTYLSCPSKLTRLIKFLKLGCNILSRVVSIIDIVLLYILYYYTLIYICIALYLVIILVYSTTNSTIMIILLYLRKQASSKNRRLFLDLVLVT